MICPNKTKEVVRDGDMPFGLKTEKVIRSATKRKKIYEQK